MLDPALFQNTTISFVVQGNEVVLRPLTGREADLRAQGSRSPADSPIPGWMIVRGAPSFPATAEGHVARRAWWEALEEAAFGLDEVFEPPPLSAAVKEWAGRFFPAGDVRGQA